MGLLAALEGRHIYLDTNVFIYHIEGHNPYQGELRQLFEAIRSGVLTAVTSRLTLAEVLVDPIQTGDIVRQAAFELAVRNQPHLQVAPVNPILREAAYVRSRIASIKLPDAIHVATAQHARCTSFVTNDKRLRRIGGPTPVILDDAIEKSDEGN